MPDLKETVSQRVHGLLIDNFIIHSQSNIHKFIVIYIITFTFNSQILNYTSHKKQFLPPSSPLPPITIKFQEQKLHDELYIISIAIPLMQYKTRHSSFIFSRVTRLTRYSQRENYREFHAIEMFKSYRVRRDTAPSIVSSRSSAFTGVSFSPWKTNIYSIKDFRGYRRVIVNPAGLIHRRRHFRKRVSPVRTEDAWKQWKTRGKLSPISGCRLHVEQRSSNYYYFHRWRWFN